VVVGVVVLILFICPQPLKGSWSVINKSSFQFSYSLSA
jgi:hypothetical protein